VKVREIIDLAIKENRVREKVLLGLAVFFIILGAIVLLWGLFQNSLIAYAGVVESLLFVPAVVLVRRINHENTALRLLEIPLRKAKTADEAAKALTLFFSAAYGVTNASKGKNSTRS
jgi:hypothetical protein